MSQAKQLGSFRVWLWARGVQIIVSLFMLDTGYRMARLRGAVEWLDILLLLLLVYVTILAHPFAYGCADEKGIVFRRYFRQHTVTWDQVAAVDWAPRSFRGVKIFLKHAKPWQRTIQFFINPSLKDAIAQLLGRTTPEIVVWLKNRIESQRPDSPSRGQGQLPPHTTENLPWKGVAKVFLGILLFLFAYLLASWLSR